MTEAETGPRPGRTQRLLGWVSLGVGAVGIGVGSGLGANAISENDESLKDCDPNDVTICNSIGLEHRNAALAAGDASTVSFIVGGALLATGVTLLVTAPKKTKVGLAAGPGFAQVSWGGTF
jgi:hypothetical protein